MKKISTLLTGAALTASCLTFAQGISLQRIGGYETRVFDEGAAEIVSYNATNQYLYSVNSNNLSVDIISLVNPTSPSLINSVDLAPYGASANAVAVGDDFFVVAVENRDSAQLEGTLQFFSLDGTHIDSVPAGVLPDNVNISPDGNFVVSANEGEPSPMYNHDPEGSITVVDISGGVENLTANNCTTIALTQFNGQRFTDGTIVTTNPGNSTVAQDLEPEYVAFNSTSSKAYVSCQENNTVITVDLATKTLDGINGLGFKDWSQTSDGFDASNRTEDAVFRKWNVYGAYQPDAMVGKNIGGTEYLFTANEGDGRDYDGFSAEPRVKELTLNPNVFTSPNIQADTALGRLKVIGGLGLNPTTNEYDSLVTFGARSFSIFNASTMALVYDSGSDIELKTYAADPANFNSTNDESGKKNRSDDKGPEPEAIAVGEFNNNMYAFVGLERQGGVIIYDVTDVNNVTFANYINYRNFDADPESSEAGDLGPECVLFIPAADNSTSSPLVVVANEVSGSISVFEVKENPTSTRGIEGSTFSVYPNPSVGLINVSEIGNYLVFDYAGKLVKSVQNTNLIDLSDLAAGIYRVNNGASSLSVVVK